MNAAEERFKILFEDSDILVVFKHAGLPVQSAGVGTADLYSMLMRHLVEERETSRQVQVKAGKKGEKPGRGQDGLHSADIAGPPYLGIVHRLDQPVEGLLVFAKAQKTASFLSAQVQDGRMEKTYMALVKPSPEALELLKRMETEKEILLRDLLIRDGRTNTSRVASKEEQGRKDAKEARLLLSLAAPEAEEERLATSAQTGKIMVKVRLLTGRHHQIRVQLSAAGLPIAGDRKYGSDDGRPFPALCAYMLSFIHPVKRNRLTFQVSCSFRETRD